MRNASRKRAAVAVTALLIMAGAAAMAGERRPAKPAATPQRQAQVSPERRWLNENPDWVIGHDGALTPRDNVAFRDDHLKALTAFNGAVRLNLHDCPQLTDAGLAHLRRLKRLYLNRCPNLPADGVRDLRAKIPDCRIHNAN